MTGVLAGIAVRADVFGRVRVARAEAEAGDLASAAPSSFPIPRLARLP
jgi:hypothetical protein